MKNRKEGVSRRERICNRELERVELKGRQRGSGTSDTSFNRAWK